MTGLPAASLAVLLVAVGVIVFLAYRLRQAERSREDLRRQFADAQHRVETLDREAARAQHSEAELKLRCERSRATGWVERLGASVLNLHATDRPSEQALADATEYHAAASRRLHEKRTAFDHGEGAVRAAQTGLHYIRAARTAMALDPGPELPALPGQERAGAVTEDRETHVRGRHYGVGPGPSTRNPHYHPGGMVTRYPIPQGWYSERWWITTAGGGPTSSPDPDLIHALFGGMPGTPYEHGLPRGRRGLTGQNRRVNGACTLTESSKRSKPATPVRSAVTGTR